MKVRNSLKCNLGRHLLLNLNTKWPALAEVCGALRSPSASGLFFFLDSFVSVVLLASTVGI